MDKTVEFNATDHVREEWERMERCLRHWDALEHQRQEAIWDALEYQRQEAINRLASRGIHFHRRRWKESGWLVESFCSAPFEVLIL